MLWRKAVIVEEVALSTCECLDGNAYACHPESPRLWRGEGSAFPFLVGLAVGCQRSRRNGILQIPLPPFTIPRE